MSEKLIIINPDAVRVERVRLEIGFLNKDIETLDETLATDPDAKCVKGIRTTLAVYRDRFLKAIE